MSKKTLTCSYLYADGHAVLIYEKEDSDAGTITFCEIHEKWTEASISFKGRIIFSRYDSEMMKLAKRAVAIRATEASTNYGSDNTKKLGIAYGSLEFSMSRSERYGNSLHFCELPGLIGGSYTYQPKNEEKCPTPDEMHWGMLRIAKFHPVPKQSTESIAA
jgi:hypothetical protein